MRHTLSEILPREVFQEIDSLENLPKALLLMDLAQEIIEAIDGFLHCPLSATTTQNLKALTTIERLKLSEHLCASLFSDLIEKQP